HVLGGQFAGGVGASGGSVIDHSAARYSGIVANSSFTALCRLSSSQLMSRSGSATFNSAAMERLISDVLPPADGRPGTSGWSYGDRKRWSHQPSMPHAIRMG